MLQAYLTAGSIIWIYASIWYLISNLVKRNDIADIAWGLGYVALSIYFFVTSEVTNRSLLIYALIIAWGIRLALHVYSRNKGKKEDYRYKQWREDWGRNFYIRSYLQVYILQGFFLVIIASPIMIISTNTQPELNWLDLAGALLWLVGFYFEAVGDWQLTRFLQDPDNKGKIMTQGLWRYTRHPNYFGEVTMWWGIFIILLSSPQAWIGIISPLLITFLLLFVSGIPLLEKPFIDNQDFQEYKQKTSAFFPLPPKKD